MDIKKPKSAHHPSSTAHRTTQKSTTLNRKFVRKPTIGASTSARRAARAAEMNRQHLRAIQQKSTTPTPTPKPVASASSSSTSVTVKRTSKPTAPPSRPLTARELKDRAIARALAEAQHLDTTQAVVIEEQMAKSVKGGKTHFWRRKKFIMALSLSLISIAFLSFLVYQNLPDIITRVTAASSGIEAGTPAFVPKGYYRDSIISEKSGKVTLTYTHSKTQKSFTITEEKSAWNSAALRDNYIVPKWGEDYAIAHEQGLTIYIAKGKAAWMNGGIFYLIESAHLSTSDLHDIAISI